MYVRERERDSRSRPLWIGGDSGLAIISYHAVSHRYRQWRGSRSIEELTGEKEWVGIVVKEHEGRDNNGTLRRGVKHGGGGGGEMMCA